MNSGNLAEFLVNWLLDRQTDCRHFMALGVGRPQIKQQLAASGDVIASCPAPLQSQLINDTTLCVGRLQNKMHMMF